MPKKSSTIFITGIAGFIGYHLALFLQQRGDDVMGCDNFNSYYTPFLKKKRAEKLREKGIAVKQCDINKIETLKPLFEKKQFSHLVHLAAQAGVRYCLENPLVYADANLTGFLHVLEMCRLFHLKLIFASSSSVYGDCKEGPCCEEDQTDAPISLYAATKKGGEMMAKSYHHLYQIPMVILRYFTVYGPWGRPDMAYFSFAESILHNKTISLFNHGDMQRDFTYIDDIVRGTAAALDYCAHYDIFNLGNHQPKPISELISLLEDSLKKKAIIDLKPMQKGDVKMTFANIGRAREKLGYCPEVSLSSGIGKFSLWFQNEWSTRLKA